MLDHQRLRTDVLALAVLAGTVYLGLCLLSYDAADPPAATVYPARLDVRNIGGIYGAWTAHALLTTFGVGAFALPIMLAVWDARLFSPEGNQDPVLRFCGALCLLAAVSIAAQLAPPLSEVIPPVGGGGYVGAAGALLLQRHFSHPGVAILLVSFALAGLVLANELRLFRTAASVCLLPLTMWDRLAFRQRVSDFPSSEVLPAEDVPVCNPDVAAPLAQPTESELQEAQSAESVTVPQPGSFLRLFGRFRKPSATEPATDGNSSQPRATVQPLDTIPIRQPAEAEVGHRDGVKVNRPFALPQVLSLFGTETATRKESALPSPELLDPGEAFPYDVLAQRARAAAETLERTFQEFNLNIRVSEIDTGPVVTQFELELEPGLRLSKVSSLADDLAIALRVPSVRVVAPIPGKNTVGVEVPNSVRVMVRLRELIENCSDELADKRIPIFLGKDVRGQPLVVDMTKMPHLLIAGRTGTGKSVCLNTLILSILMTRSPEQVKMLMIDPKMVELSPYMKIPHLMHPVITDMKKAEAVLGWAVDKMEERYDLLARVGVRHLDSYNKLGKDEVLDRLGIDPDSEEADAIPEQMPYIVIIADEMADMIMTSGKDVEGYIIRLAQKSRAVGIHLVLATQKPTVDVITGLIKSNLPARIAFQVSSRMDSRVVLDEQGAEKLLGNGDLLYLAPGTSNLTRAQGSFVSDDEVMRVIEHFADQPPQYSDEIVQVTNAAARAASAKAGGGEARERDDLYDQAVEIVIREGRGSTSLLQRAMGIGYGRAARMIDWMAEDGIVGTFNGSQAREVVMTIEEWEDQRAASGAR